MTFPLGAPVVVAHSLMRHRCAMKISTMAQEALQRLLPALEANTRVVYRGLI
jgi:hypothetical protein